jgi:hypothetical protein
MKKIILKNTIIVSVLVILIIPYNLLFQYLPSSPLIIKYMPVIVYAVLCGVSLFLMDLTNKRVNIIFTIFYFIFGILNIQYSLYSYGPTVFLLFLMFGAMLTLVIKKSS